MFQGIWPLAVLVDVQVMTEKANDEYAAKYVTKAEPEAFAKVKEDDTAFQQYASCPLAKWRSTFCASTSFKVQWRLSFSESRRYVYLACPSFTCVLRFTAWGKPKQQ